MRVIEKILVVTAHGVAWVLDRFTQLVMERRDRQ